MTRRMLMGFAAVATLAFLGGGAFAADDEHGPYGLPTVKTMKERITTLTDDQIKKIDEIYGGYKKKSKEDKVDTAEYKSMRKEIVNKVKEVLSDEQDKKYDSLIETSK